MDNEITDNHKRYLERKALYKSFGYNLDKEREFILAQAGPLEGKILEAGTGKGYFALALANKGHFFVTFDISPEEQRYAKLNLAYSGFVKFADFKIEDAEHTSFESGSFDLIFSVNVLHHLNKPFLVMDEFIRLLSMKGRLVLADFTTAGFKVMEQIHTLEGKVHHVGEIRIPEIESYLIQKGYMTRKERSIYQQILIAEKGNA